MPPRGVESREPGGRKPRIGGSKAEKWRVKSREMGGRKPRIGSLPETQHSPNVTPMRVPALAAHQALLPCGFRRLPLTRRYSHAGSSTCHSPGVTPMRVPAPATHQTLLPCGFRAQPTLRWSQILALDPRVKSREMGGQKPRIGGSKAENWGVESRESGVQSRERGPSPPPT